MATQEHAHAHTGYKQYFVTWCWLLAMTLLALAFPAAVLVTNHDLEADAPASGGAPAR